MNLPAMHRILAFAVGALAWLSGCSGWTMHEETRDATAPAVAAAAGISVTTRNGSIKVVPGDADEVRISARLRARTPERLAQMRVTAEEDAEGVLVVRVEPAQGEWWGNEGCAISITTPADRPTASVTARTSNGRIEVAGVAGPVDLRTSNGAVEARDCSGKVFADSSNGSIMLAGISGPVEAETSNGSITARLADSAAGPVDLDTSNGSVTLEVGQAFTGTLSVATSNGLVTVPSAGRPTIVKRGRHSANLRFGDAPGDSTIRTSNGSVTVNCR
ncbi:MAG: DUF4097 family beta strand repeat protein [Phycisphaerales bacterium]|nr:DUF4097 family beta strand repeat protein [Phycisphaerales bacterium]